MRLIALLSARAFVRDWLHEESAAGTIRLGVQAPVEYQARQAIAAGADALIISLDTPDPALTRAADRLTRETGVPISLVSDGPALGRLLQDDDRVLVIAERMVVPLGAIEQLRDETAPALLVTPTVQVTARFERIDATHVWAGAALLPASTVLSTIDMLGEWDLVLTLLRRAVQADARRLVLPPELVPAGRLLLLESQADADRALAAQLNGSASGGGLSGLLAPVRRGLVAELAQREVDPAWLNLAAGACAVAALAAVTADWSVLALLLALLGGVAHSLGTASTEAMLRRRPAPWLGLLVEGAGLAVLAMVGGRLALGQALALAGVGVPIVLVAVLSFARHRKRTDYAQGDWRVWAQLTTAMALSICLIGSLFGGLVGAFVLIAVLALGAVAVELLTNGAERI